MMTLQPGGNQRRIRIMETADRLGIGLYSLADAARLLATPRRTLSRWVEGYVQQLRDTTKAYTPVVPAQGEGFLTFGDLVELMYVRGFRDASVPLDVIRQAAGKYRADWNISYPFATKRFATNGRALLLDQGGDWANCLTGQRVAFFEEIGSQLVHLGDLASEWRPLGTNRAVVLDPGRAFGKPIDSGSGTDTFTLFRALKAGDTAEDIAWWYGTTTNAVNDAAEFEQGLLRR